MNAPAQLDLKLDLTPGDKGAYVVKDREIVFKQETTQQEWETITRQLSEVFSHTGIAHVRIGFLLGDALNYGEQHFSEECAQAIDATREHMRLSIKTMQNFQWIAGKILPQDRHELLTMAHHEAVAKLPPAQQRELLDEAQSEALPVSKLKAKVREISPSRPRAIKSNKKRKGEAVGVTQEAAVEAAAVLAEFAAPYVGKKPSELTPKIKAAFDENIRTIHNFARRFIRKN